MPFLERFLDRNWARLWNTYFRIRKWAGVPAFPDDVQWLATSRCNLSCRHCGSDSGKTDPGELSTREMFALIDDLELLHPKHLTLTGGEPLLREDLFEILAYAAKKGIRYNLVTNSTNVPRLAKELEALPPMAVKVSIDGVPETHAYMRGDPDNFQACLEALTFFKGLGIGTRVICTTLNQRNISEIGDLFKFVLSSDATFWEFHLPVFEGRALENHDWMKVTKEQTDGIFRFILENQPLFPIFLGEGCGYCGSLTKRLYLGRRFFCGSGWTTFTIMNNGDVAGCPAFRKDWTEGNIREESVVRIWSDRFERFRKVTHHLEEDCRKCGHLSACLGGCWLHRRTGDHCFREIWDPEQRKALKG